MNWKEKYSEYLNSPEWQEIRARKLGECNHKCAVCGQQKGIEVHHLTYARIFNEALDDLLPLCPNHHSIAESYIKSGVISRIGNVSKLRKHTISTLRKHDGIKNQSKPGSRKINKTEIRNRTQLTLASQAWFLEALLLNRKGFAKVVRKVFQEAENKGVVMANCFALYDRNSRKAEHNRLSHHPCVASAEQST